MSVSTVLVCLDAEPDRQYLKNLVQRVTPHEPVEIALPQSAVALILRGEGEALALAVTMFYGTVMPKFAEIELVVSHATVMAFRTYGEEATVRVVPGFLRQPSFSHLLRKITLRGTSTGVMGALSRLLHLSSSDLHLLSPAQPLIALSDAEGEAVLRSAPPQSSTVSFPAPALQQTPTSFPAASPPPLSHALGGPSGSAASATNGWVLSQLGQLLPASPANRFHGEGQHQQQQQQTPSGLPPPYSAASPTSTIGGGGGASLTQTPNAMGASPYVAPMTPVQTFPPHPGLGNRAGLVSGGGAREEQRGMMTPSYPSYPSGGGTPGMTGTEGGTPGVIIPGPITIKQNGAVNLERGPNNGGTITMQHLSRSRDQQDPSLQSARARTLEQQGHAPHGFSSSASSDIAVEEIIVPEPVIKRLVGRGGSTVTGLECASGASMTIVGQEEGSPFRTLRIAGTRQQVRRGYHLASSRLALLGVQLDAHREVQALVVLIREEDVGRVVGPKGTTARMIEHESGAVLSITRRSRANPLLRMREALGDTPLGSQDAQVLKTLCEVVPGTRAVLIVGNAEARQRARTIVENLTSSEDVAAAMMPGPSPQSAQQQSNASLRNTVIAIEVPSSCFNAVTSTWAKSVCSEGPPPAASAVGVGLYPRGVPTAPRPVASMTAEQQFYGAPGGGGFMPARAAGVLGGPSMRGNGGGHGGGGGWGGIHK
uniref:K Homology domain-containing protein n=1 Tax=Chromera velia CCMP2878 TaxID=1169474 RepID=A0A0G4HWQ0_9ALVE|eukprot:Cvel_9122.t1-p1 / transcript=Cvel_9122.t1 / gene=Cvel_9122 / organism=Chromera_velia_CCMP2878 / gene_product=hypothetical protein / transcript_product=hypothetical protein / location=Cvel_scaffold518:49986-53779(+) / protein_length=710 / sequence_SO=supercontig / SO=protein_coding / is_pseudo=false